MAQSTSAEAVTQLMQALELLAGLPAGVDRDRQELDLQIALGGAFVATKGFAAPEVGRAYGRARELCTNEAHTQQLLAAMSGLFVYHEHSTSVDAALEVAKELLHLARRRSDTTAQVAGHRCLGAGLLFNGQLRAALAHFEQALALYDPADHASTVFLWSSEQRLACLNFEALVLLMQGYPDQALAHSREGLAVAHQLGHAYSLSHALHLNCWLGQIRGEPQIVRKQAGTMMSLTSEHGFATWSATAAIFHGWALASEGEVAAGIAQMRHGTAAKQAIGELLQQAHFLGLLAGVCTRVGNPAEALDLLAEALALVDRMDERWFEAELHRLMGEALLRTTAADVAAAEASFRKAIDVAREQDAKWWELRAATSLARLWAERGERRKARDLLAPVCGWFTEGFDTLDLKEAGTLLDELR
jgi:predicted ATPase